MSTALLTSTAGLLSAARPVPRSRGLDVSPRSPRTDPCDEATRSAGPGDGDALPQHIASHRHLVALHGPVPWLSWRDEPIDAVVVPSYRRDNTLTHAVRVARRCGATLTVLCSGASDPEEVYRKARGELPTRRVQALEIPSGWRLPGMAFRADGSALVSGYVADTPLKRNIALALGTQLRWRRVLFLDDDVTGFRRRELRQATGPLRDGPAPTHVVGWAFDDFPDNSLTCHAYRLSGRNQSTFIGGGALMVRLGALLPHFPQTYNEDWFFMLPAMLGRRQHVTFAGTLRQRPFDPFAHPEQASVQEAGEVLAEGLFRLLHRRDQLGVARSPEYWSGFLRMRRTWLRETKERLVRRSHRTDQYPTTAFGNAIAALDAASGAHGRTWPEQLAAWVADWRSDHVRWAAYLKGLGDAEGSFPRAAGRIGLVTAGSYERRSRGRRPVDAPGISPSELLLSAQTARTLDTRSQPAPARELVEAVTT